jgi:serine/threonine protein kinase
MSRPGVLTSIQKAKLLSDTSGLEYLTNRLNTEVTWIGGYGLGSGSYGEVTLWICIDNKTRMPLKECAIKDTFENVSTSTEEKGLYTNVYHDLVAKGMDFGVDPWSKFLGQADVERRFLKEAYLQGIMTEPDSKQEIFSVPLWGYARKAEGLRPGYNHWRLYLPLYDYGDMWDLIRDHLVMKRAIPEPFIWHTLHCLFTASEQLSQLPRKCKGATDSDVIVVFDMKPDNILLAPPNQNSTFPTYPRPHIADLGGGCKFTTLPSLRIICASLLDTMLCSCGCHLVFNTGLHIQGDAVACSTTYSYRLADSLL